MNTSDIIDCLGHNRSKIANRFKARVIGIFGSYARGDYRAGSDLDLLYEPLQPDSFGFAELNDLEDFLAALVKVPKVDLVDVNYINPVIEMMIQDEIKYVP